ncbi:MAG: chaperone modulator CbpM [Chitinophagaceae bacterium]|nr:chaperone modulator CbpM [Chitinophagaceae bacterium]
MPSDHLIPAEKFCTQHNIELSFISLLHENGLIEVTTVAQTTFISEDCLPDLEKIMRLHYELDINLEGIEAITHLLQRIENMQDELRVVRTRLQLYESRNI